MRHRIDRQNRFLAMTIAMVMIIAALGTLPGLALADDQEPADTIVGDIEPTDVYIPPFKITVQTKELNQVFILPTASYFGGSFDGKSYNWQIDWGDRMVEDHVGTSSDGGGIKHTYVRPGVHEITLRPNGSPEAWLSAFGFDTNDTGSNAAENKAMVVSVPCYIVPEMTRTTDQIQGITRPPDYEWFATFYQCVNLTQAPLFAEWEGITAVGNHFANYMFSYCSSLVGLIDGFNLPDHLVAAGDSFASGMFSGCTSLAALPNSFNLPQSLTRVGNNFALRMFFDCESLPELPVGFNLPPLLSQVGYSFAQDMFYSCSHLTGLPKGFNIPQNITDVGNNFLDGLFGACTQLASVPEGFNLPQGIEIANDGFAYYMFGNCAKLEKLPSSFNLPQQIYKVGDDFVWGMFSDCYSLSELPPEFNLPKNISAAGNGFAWGLFAYCGNLAYLSKEFNLPQGLETVGVNFAGSMFFKCAGLIALPDAFNLPKGITQAGNGFASFMFYGAGSEVFQMNKEFFFPVGVSVRPEQTFYQTLVLSDKAPLQIRTAESIIGACRTPMTNRYTFNECFPDIKTIPVNWGGGGLTPPEMGDPGSGDLNGDGFVTMDEVIIALNATTFVTSLSEAQLAIIDMDHDGVITMMDVILMLKKTV
ncbi:MAG: leucine-rich repeat protein [Coriobacteriia bacterium]|nr:leucine-rich repeat protein [Coriobacteriia bacterium]